MVEGVAVSCAPASDEHRGRRFYREEDLRKVRGPAFAGPLFSL